MRKRYAKYALRSLPIVLFGGIVSFVILSSVFTIKIITVVGQHKVTEREILANLPIGYGDHMLFLSAKRAEACIASDPRIAHVDIRRRLPDKIDISIGEEHPALLLSADRISGLTESGKLLPIDNPYEIPNLPILSGIGAEKIIEPFTEPVSERFRVGIEFWREIKDKYPPFLDRISEIHVEENGDIQLILAGDGLTVEFGTIDCALGVPRLIAVLDEIGVERAGVSSIDLRYSDQAVVKSDRPEKLKPAG